MVIFLACENTIPLPIDIAMQLEEILLPLKCSLNESIRIFVSNHFLCKWRTSFLMAVLQYPIKICGNH
ncbi:hypothetical protein ASC83_12805 [Acidovorax sp. Root402]|nr:hypothetical protein ASC83_12805 [Acidovorax sp. Root402]